MVDVTLSKPQFRFVNTQSQFPAFVGGFGSGKTHALTWRAIVKKFAYPKLSVAYYLPTYDLVRTIGFPRFSELLEDTKVPYKINRADSYITIENGGEIIFRTMDRPERIIGYEVADSLVDELDTLKTEKAREVWEKIIGRNRQKKLDGSLNTVGVGTTPEGFKFVYEQWAREKKKGYELIKASTMSNSANLPDGYIDSLRETYPSNLLAAYLDGEFVNLTSGSVYFEFDRKLNASTEVITGNEALHVGMDFNVGKMSAVIHVLRGDNPHAVEEITDVLDTPSIATLIKQRYPNHKIFIYPDASGNSRKSNNASTSDISILREFGFQVLNNNRNPFVKDRVLAMNSMIHKDGERRYLINVQNCPALVESLEKQAYNKNGEPDKESGLDHVVDAAGYFISYRYPVLKSKIRQIQVTGI